MDKRPLLPMELRNRARRPGDPERRTRAMAGDETPEETLARRRTKRLAAVSAVQRSTEFLEVSARLGPPAVPDPRDMTVSKRAWERSVMRFRAAVRDAACQLANVAADG